MSKTILDICGGTGAWSSPYRDEYNVRVLTLPDFDVEKWREDKEFVELLHSNTVHGILAAPPCTDFSIARNDTTALRKRDVRASMKTVQACLDIIHECLYEPFRINENSLKFWAIENPNSGYLKRYLGKPALVFEPYYYGDTYTKRTALWGMFNKPKRNDVDPKKRGNNEGTFVKEVEHFFHLKKHQIPEGYKEKTGLTNRTIIRSITPECFAKAFYKANR